MKKKSFLLALMALFVLIACNNENVEEQAEGKLQISATIGVVTSRAQKTEWNNGDKMGLFVCHDELGIPYQGKYVNVPFTYNGMFWESERVYLDNKEATVFAYYPYMQNITDGKRVPVESASQTDYLYGVGDNKATSMNTNVNINMYHALTQVVFRMKQDDYTDGDGILTKVEIMNQNTSTILQIQGTMDLSTGKVTGSSAGILSLLANHSITEDYTQFSAISLPVERISQTGDIRVVFSIDHKDYYYEFPALTAWNPGYRNIYTFTLTDTGLIIGGEDGNGITIEPWDDDDYGEVILIPLL